MAVTEKLEIAALRLTAVSSPLKAFGFLLLVVGVTGIFAGTKAAAFSAVLASFWLLGLYFFCQLFYPSITESGAVVPLSSRIGASSPFARLYAQVFVAVWFSGLCFMILSLIQRVRG